MSLKIILFQLHCSICSFELKNLANSRPSASNFKRFPRSLEQFFLSLGQNNFGNKIPFLLLKKKSGSPVLYTVGLKTTFWNMNSFVWAVWAAQGSKEKKVDLRFCEQLLRVVFSTFCGKKKKNQKCFENILA
jgi:hypothetical protein